MKTIRIWIDGKEIEASEGQSVLDAALEAGIYIPHLCSHPDLAPAGNCRLCVVQIEGVDGIQTSCETICRDGMRVTTKSEKLRHLRNVALELMLAGHPHDCTSCKAYLKCELQALMQYQSVVHARMHTIKRETASLISRDPMIIREPERCVSCGRCVRACRDLRGIGVLDFYQMNGETYVGTKDHQPLSGLDCRFCGACVEVCPTGALQDAEGVFRNDLPKSDALVPCQAECPARIDIPSYVRLVGEGDFGDAVAVIREKVPFPYSLGFVCNHLCEKGCKRGKLNDAVSIRELKRIAVEEDKQQAWRTKAVLPLSEKSGRSVAVVGSGPAGSTAAYYLARKGHDVTVFERLPVAGGMLAACIPEYRLPSKAVASEIDLIKEAGVDFVCNREIKDVRELKAGFDAVLVATGAWTGKKLRFIPGGDAKGTLSALELLQAAKCGQPLNLGQTVNVIGGGNVAFDCARTLIRLGKTVNVICLEKGEKMLADKEEITEAQHEGVRLYDGVTTISIETDQDRITGHRIIDVENFMFDASGKLVVNTMPGTERLLPCDNVVFAAGQGSHLDAEFGLELNKFGYPVLNTETMCTNLEGVFAAGDVVTGTRFVIDAIAAGRRAAEQIDRYLGGDGVIDEQLAKRRTANAKLRKIEGFASLPREAGCGLNCTEAAAESARCLQCDLRRNIRKVRMWTEFSEGRL